MAGVSQIEMSPERLLHEEQFVKAFIPSGKRERTAFLLLSPQRRRKFTNQLAHFDGFDPRFTIPVTPSLARTASEMVLLLQRKGAGESSWIISEHTFLDGKNMPLDEAVRVAWGGSFGTIVSCVPGKLAFFRSEEMKSELLLQHP